MKIVGILFILLFCFESKSNINFNAKSTTLENGLRLIVVENPRAPVVAQMMWYNFGSNIEQRGKSGLAHFMEHLMFKGTKKFPNSYYSDHLSKIGGSENAFTSYDYTAYYQIFPSQHLEKIIELEADRMNNLTLTKKNVEIEKKVILEERFQRIESDPSAQLDESMRTVLFPNDYYGRPIIGWKHEIENLSYDDVIDFYKENYNPNNAILILSGDIKFKNAKKLVNKYYKSIKSSQKIKLNKLNNPDLKTSTNVELSNENVKQQIWKRIYRTKSYNDSMTQLTKGNGYIYFYAIPNKKVEQSEISDLLDKFIVQAIDEGISEEKLILEKKKYYFDSIYGMDGILKPAEIIGEALTIGLSLDDIENWNDKLDEINLEMVKKELKEFSKNRNFVTGNLKN